MFVIERVLSLSWLIPPLCNPLQGSQPEWLTQLYKFFSLFSLQLLYNWMLGMKQRVKYRILFSAELYYYTWAWTVRLSLVNVAVNREVLEKEETVTEEVEGKERFLLVSWLQVFHISCGLPSPWAIWLFPIAGFQRNLQRGLPTLRSDSYTRI